MSTYIRTNCNTCQPELQRATNLFIECFSNLLHCKIAAVSQSVDIFHQQLTLFNNSGCWPLTNDHWPPPHWQQYLHNIYTLFTQNLYKIYSILTKYLHAIYTTFTHYWHNNTTIFTQFFHNIYTIYTQFVHNIYTIFTQY